MTAWEVIGTIALVILAAFIRYKSGGLYGRRFW